MPAQVEDVLFEEEQSFRQTWLWVLMVGTLAILTVSFGIALFKADGQEDIVPAITGVGFGIVVAIGAAFLIYYMKLIVRVDAGGLHVRFRPLVKRDIPLHDIARCEARTYHPILEYGGWGIRCSWKGMAYNVSGNRGAQLEFTNGKRLLIGSQRPEELAAAIDQAKQQAG
jgi:hypothetical protein